MNKTVLAVMALALTFFCNDVTGGDGGGKESAKKTFSVTDSRNVQRAVAQRMSTVIDAYKERLNDKPDLAAGVIAVRFTIDLDGKVFFAEVEKSTVGDEAFENTVLEIVKTWIFTKKDGLGSVSEIFYTFAFERDR